MIEFQTQTTKLCVVVFAAVAVAWLTFLGVWGAGGPGGLPSLELFGVNALAMLVVNGAGWAVWASLGRRRSVTAAIWISIASIVVLAPLTVVLALTVRCALAGPAGCL